MNLTIDQRKLLERLYNLKSEDSIIIKEVNEKIKDNKENFNVLSDESKKLEEERKTFTTNRVNLDKQFSEFVTEFGGMKTEKYTLLLDEAKESFDPEKMLANIKSVIPSRIEEIDTLIKNSEDEINVTKKKISENEIESTEFEGKLTDALQMQDRLRNLINESLHGNGSITRDSVQELLSSLSFNEDEITELGKMILFPEGTLQAFNEEFKLLKEQASIQPEEETNNEDSMINETNDISIDNGLETKEVPLENPLEIKPLDNFPTIEQPKFEEPKIEEQPKEEVIVEETKEKPSSPITSNLSVEELAKKNIEYLKSLQVNKDVIKRYETVLTDETLIEKVKFFLDNNKTAKDLELNFDILIVYSLEDLKNLKSICEESEINFQTIPLGLLKQGLTGFFTNLELLISKGIKLDQAELSKNISTLFIDTETFKNNLEMISRYQISLTKKNGKQAIQCLAQDTKELIKGIDAIIETGEENLFVETPEKLSTNLIDVATKIKYCKKNGVPIKSNNGSYYDFIFSDDEFQRIFDGVDLSDLPLPDKDKIAQGLNKMISPEVAEALNNMDLNTVYNNVSPFQNIQFEMTDLTKTFANTIVNKYSYTVENAYFSKERIERNLNYLLNKNVNVDLKELIIGSVLYDSIYTEEEMITISEALKGGLQ